ncbi:MAG: hypothetical protein QOK36_962 [Gaiellales bacterium]|jgi:hypothetical protein|nr:hypothetical protein [Gaiellales bacterium]
MHHLLAFGSLERRTPRLTPSLGSQPGRFAGSRASSVRRRATQPRSEARAERHDSPRSSLRMTSNGLKRVTLHEARLSFGSYLAASGIGIEDSTVILGHSSVTVSLDRQRHQCEAGDPNRRLGKRPRRRPSAGPTQCATGERRCPFLCTRGPRYKACPLARSGTPGPVRRGRRPGWSRRASMLARAPLTILASSGRGV